MNKYNLEGKAAIVTGARRGIGKSIALKLSKNGASVAVTDISKEECQEVVDDLENKGLALKLDVTDEKNIKQVVKKTKKEFGKIDILVNNAGIHVQKDLDNMDTSEIEKILDVNLRGTILCSKHVTPVMKEQKYGKIINISSVAGFGGFAKSSIYCATKGGLIALTKELAMELGEYSINVNGIAPGVIKTKMTEAFIKDKKMKAGFLQNIPYGRIGKTEDISNAVAFLVSDESEYITGHVLVVDGGWLSSL